MIPEGFVITARGYDQLLDHNKLRERIRLLLNDPELLSKPVLLKKHANAIRMWLREASVPIEIKSALKKMVEKPGTQQKRLWAVRPSVVNEETSLSMTGLTDYKLEVPEDQLFAAYLEVIASHFSENALNVRINLGMHENKTPMSVLVMPMINVASQGVFYSRDIDRPENDTYALTVSGSDHQHTKTVHLAKDPPFAIEAPDFPTSDINLTKTLQSVIPELCKTAEIAVKKTGSELVLEWVQDEQGHLLILQGRLLQIQTSEPLETRTFPKKKLLASGGMTVFSGLAEGEVVYLSQDTQVEKIQKGSIVIVENSELDLAPIVPGLAALLFMAGDPSDAISILALESSVPCICQMGRILHRLKDTSYISVDATRKQVFEGSCWPGVQSQTMARIMELHRSKISEPIFGKFLASNLSKTAASAFKTKSCDSILDIIHFISEIAVRSLFKFGDSQKKRKKDGIYSLVTKLPLKLDVVDMDRSIHSTEKKILPEEIQSAALSALWRGISDIRLHWPNRWKSELIGLPGDLQKAVLGEDKEPRKAKATNYVILSRTHMNFNARVSYHYVMVDTIIGPGVDNNHIFFRFRGSGGSDAGVQRCAEFVETILKKQGFGINRNNGVVAAWLMYASNRDSLQILEKLGRLIVCARELDAVLKVDADTRSYADSFMNEKFERFS